MFSGWLRSRGRLPCLAVVVDGPELRVEALLSGVATGGDAGVGAVAYFVSMYVEKIVTTIQAN